MSWLYLPLYLALIVVCFIQTIYPLFMLAAMLFRQSRLLYALFHKVDTTSKQHGGELVAKVLKSHGVGNIFTLPGGHVSPIVVASHKLDIKVIDVRHEATAVFAADASARLTGVPGVAVVTAGPGLTNTITAIKNAQLAESPVVIIAGAAATMLKGRGSLQDIDQISLLKTATKKCFSVDCVRDIAPTLREAFRMSLVQKPGPVFVELPVDILYPYNIIADQFTSMSAASSSIKQKDPIIDGTSEKTLAKKNISLKNRIISAYSNYCLNHIFADAWKDRDYDPLPVHLNQPKMSQVREVAEILQKSRRPLCIIGSQAVLKPYGPDNLASNIKKLGIPVFLNGSARGLMGTDYTLQFRHARKTAVQEADCVILLGAICDFRLSYGRIFSKSSKVISVNRCIKAASLNSGIFWRASMTIESDVGAFVSHLTQQLSRGIRSISVDSESTYPDSNTLSTKLSLDEQWVSELIRRDVIKDQHIVSTALEKTDKYINPLKLLTELKKTFDTDDTIIVADGGDFVASASYIMKPSGPLRWLDPGPFGTLGCGAGFALAAKLIHPDRQVLAIMGDGAFGYAIAELDTFVRHKIPIYWIVGNDACWTQIAREQVPMLGSSIGCELAYTDYERVAEGFGANGYKLSEDSDLSDKRLLQKTRNEFIDKNRTVVVNALIGKTNFRDGSISV